MSEANFGQVTWFKTHCAGGRSFPSGTPRLGTPARKAELPVGLAVAALVLRGGRTNGLGPPTPAQPRSTSGTLASTPTRPLTWPPNRPPTPTWSVAGAVVAEELAHSRPGTPG